MSWQPCEDPKPGDARACDAIEHVVVPGRAISAASKCAARCRRRASRWSARSSSSTRWGRRSFSSAQGIDVRPHPHIGLATVTYLFDGGIMHRDSARHRRLLIKPGAAQPDDGRTRHRPFRAPGAEERATRRGCSASRRGWRCPSPTRKRSRRTSRITARRAAAHRRETARRCALIMGSALRGQSSPVETFRDDCFYAEAALAPGAMLPLDPDYDERAIYHRLGQRSTSPAADVRGRAGCSCSGRATASRSWRSTRSQR